VEFFVKRMFADSMKRNWVYRRGLSNPKRLEKPVRIVKSARFVKFAQALRVPGC